MAPLDDLLDGGIRGGEVFVLAARPGVGKSSFALQVIMHVARSGHPVALWSLEMHPKQWVRRAICALSGIQPRRLRRGELDVFDEPMFRDAANELLQLPINFAVTTASTPSGFAAEAEVQVTQNKSRLLVIDYLQLMQPEPGVKNREQEVAMASRTIKAAALEHNVGVMLLAQLNRNAEGKPPFLSDLRESGSVEQDADEVFFLHRERDTEKHVLSDAGAGILAKNRDGATGSFGIRFDGPRYRFEAVDKWRMKAMKQTGNGNGRREYENR